MARVPVRPSPAATPAPLRSPLPLYRKPIGRRVDAHIERFPMPTSPIRRAAARQWAVLVAIIVVVLVVSGAYRLHGIFGSQDQTSRPSADSPENTGFDPKRVHLQVLGDPGALATINF